MFLKITKLFSYFCIAALLTTTLFSAPNGKIRGTVTDAVTGDPLPYTNMILVGTSFGTATDEDGKYELSNVIPGKYTLRVSYIGYEQQEISVEVFSGKVIEHDFKLGAGTVLGDTLIVTAQAMGQKKAINEQLSSMEIKNVVSAARIQELPDANAAESVGRLPGVSILRTGGEGSKVVVRGLSPQYNQVTIDGVEIPSNVSSSDPENHKDEFSGDDDLSVSGDRATDLSMISSNMLGGIEVIKAITPDMDATVLGGVVNFSMRKAVKGIGGKPKFEGIVQGMYADLKDSYNYKLVGSYEQRFWDDKFGLFFQGSYEKKDLSSNVLYANYHYDQKVVDNEDDYPEFVYGRLSDVIRNRDRYGATLVLDYKYDNGSIGFMNFYSRSETDADTRSEEYYLENNDLFYKGGYSRENLDVVTNLLSIDQEIGSFQVDVRLSHSYSSSKTPENITFNFWQDIAGLEDRYGALKYSEFRNVLGFINHDYESAEFYEISDVENTSKDRTYNAKLDISRDFTLSDFITADLKLGGAYQYRKRDYDYEERSGSVYYDDGDKVISALLNAYPQLGDEITFSDFIDEDYEYGEFFEGKYSLGSPMDIDMVHDYIKIARENQGTSSGGGYKRNKISSVLYDYEGHEERTAAYAMATFNIGSQFVVLPGVRYQNLKTVYGGNRAKVPEESNKLDWDYVEKTLNHGYVLPMLHLRYMPQDWLQIRFAYTNTLNYPDYNAIIPNYYVGRNYIIYNNYELKPAESENFDVMVSAFSNEVGLFSIGGFKKSIKNLIFNTRFYPDNFDDFPELVDDITDGQVYALYTYINNDEKIDVWGLETEWQTSFWYLPAPLNNIVLNVNYTHIFSEAEYPKTITGSYLDSNFIQQTLIIDTTYSTRLLNQPNDILNIALGYDYEGFSCRVSMVYQDNIFKKPDFSYQNREHSDEYMRFDLSMRQSLPWYGLQVFLNLNNITGEDDVDINQKNGFDTNRQRYGMSGDLGLRVRF